MSKLTHEHVKKFRNSLIDGDNKLSPAMATKVFVSFKSMLRSVHCSHLADNIRVSSGKRHEHKVEVGRDYPTPDEVRRLFSAAATTPKYLTFLKVAVFTGLRSSELFGLRWSDVDLKASELHVRQRADRWGNIGPLKTGSSRRTVPFGPDLLRVLRQWRLACPKGEADLVFPTKDGTVGNYGSVMSGLQSIMEAAHVVDKKGRSKYGLHAFRHFYASWCINPKDRGGRELTPKVVQALMGHTSIAMTLDVYGHLFPSGSDRAELAASEAALLG